MARWKWALLAVLALPVWAEIPADKAKALADLSGLSPAEVQSALAGAEKNQKILDAIATPWEAKPWYQYRPIFITPERLAKGLAFWHEHEAVLAKAQAQYQVPASVIVAILGVETYYGQHQGVYPVRDALYTLGFFYEPRQDFFFKELGQYLKLAKEQGWQQSPLGSYAGAMGQGQFIPSSYQHFAVDFNGDGKRDLFSSEDAIGSVANYFHEHGWRLGEPVLAKADIKGQAPLTDGLEIDSTVAALKAQGVEAGKELGGDTPAKLFAFALKDGTDYQLGFHNFYVITRYNRSPLYARAVWTLAQQLEQAHAG
ncbi:lytic murein transglycosylase B [Gallaecimonas kandeliae]|uniref:lytic murein transglycosylase B n=1 Tax=Gallaecimonas kandeliae TaxID=3029055 RepID=UPI002648B382|nr:lytic murein transglycosylase B [Gallaecimonas kandeliae]WKE66625.1 lytic murein transglycosylase B [Gallaecimonas kandeliae]